MPFPLVNPGDKFKPSASLSNAVRRHLNETDGFGSGVNLAKNTHFIRVPVFNNTLSTIPAGKAVSLQLNGNMRGDAYPVVTFDEVYPCFGVCPSAIESGKIGDCVLSGIAVVSISGGTAGAYLKPVEGGTFERGDEGVQIINISGSSAVVLLGDYRALDYEAGDGINSDLITGGTISLNLIGVGGCTVSPVVGSTNGQMQVYCSGGTGGGNRFFVPEYSSLAFGYAAPDYSLGHTFILAVKAGDIGIYDDGGGAIGKWTNISGTTSHYVFGGTTYHAEEDGFLRISVMDRGHAPGACMGFSSPTGGFPLYKYGSFGSVTGIGYTLLSGGTASVTVTGGTGAVKFKGDGTVQIMGVRRTATAEEISEWGRRYNPATGQMDGDWKNAGWRGIIPLANGSVMTEYSVSEEIGGVEVGYPLIVPTTTDEELKIIEQAIIQEDDSLITQAIEDKAYDWAEARIAEGLSPFYNGDEEDEPLRVIDDSIIVMGSGATGITSTVVSGSTSAEITLTGGTGSVIVESGNANVTIDGSTNGRIRISATGSGGGGGYIPAWGGGYFHHSPSDAAAKNWMYYDLLHNQTIVELYTLNPRHMTAGARGYLKGSSLSPDNSFTTAAEGYLFCFAEILCDGSATAANPGSVHAVIDYGQFKVCSVFGSSISVGGSIVLPVRANQTIQLYMSYIDTSSSIIGMLFFENGKDYRYPETLNRC